MSPRLAEERGAQEGRIAVVGAPTADGNLLREELERARVPGARVNLYGVWDGEAMISEYAGEARLIQEPDLDEIASHDLIFLCESGEVADQVLAAAPPETLVIDLHGSSPRGVPRVHLDLNPQVLQNGGGRRYVVPHPLALLLSEILHPLDRGPGLAEASAVIVRPAADFGQEGVEELRQQTVRLLSFAEVPVDTFGRQLAFNIIPQAGLTVDERELESRIVQDVAALLGWESSRLAVKLITAPVFYGHGIQLRFRPDAACAEGEIRRLLDQAGLPDPAAPVPAPTPLDVIGETRTAASDLCSDGLGGYWLWIVAGEAGAKGAREAVRLATHLGLLA
jgi:aspartate-semialdehyde dehydrogenase